jgi:hypothetical protein
MFINLSALYSVEKNDMQSDTANPITSYLLCEEKAAKVMQWISESEDASKTHFAVARLFEIGVLKENTKAFLHLLLEEKYPEKRIKLELTPEEMRVILTDAFIKTYLYLLTPQSFIPDFLAFRTEVVHINQAMLSRLSYFVDYPYFQEMIDEWLTIQLQKGKDEISTDELKNFLKDVDYAIIKYSSLEQIAAYLALIYEYYNVNVIDGDTLSIFLADKGLSLPKDTQNNEFLPDETALIIKESFLARMHTETPADLQPVPEYNTFLKELREIGVIIPPPNGGAIQEKEKKKVLPPIQMFINSRLHKKCLEEIFHLNTHEYDRMIKMLNSTSEYSHAELNLRTLFHMHKVARHSKVAIRLIEALRLRFGGLSIKNS